MGDDVLKPFAQIPNKIGIVLVRTSNRGGCVVQDIQAFDGKPMWRHVLHLVVHRWNVTGNLIPVLSTDCGAMNGDIRRDLPDDMPIFLCPAMEHKGGPLEGYEPF